MIDDVAEGRLELGKEGQKVMVTVLVLDILDFSAISENLLPEKIVYLLNTYSDLMVQAVFKNGGILDKSTGDGIIAVFGVPDREPNDRVRAVSAAIAMNSQLTDLNKRFNTQGLPELKIGIGIATGEVVAGRIGSKERMDYTVIGKTVDIASTLQGYCEELGISVVMDDMTATAVQKTYSAKELSSVSIPEEKQPLKIWTLC